MVVMKNDGDGIDDDLSDVCEIKINLLISNKQEVISYTWCLRWVVIEWMW